MTVPTIENRLAEMYSGVEADLLRVFAGTSTVTTELPRDRFQHCRVFGPRFGPDEELCKAPDYAQVSRRRQLGGRAHRDDLNIIRAPGESSSVCPTLGSPTEAPAGCSFASACSFMVRSASTYMRVVAVSS
jgi:hypothetical protein